MNNDIHSKVHIIVVFRQNRGYNEISFITCCNSDIIKSSHVYWALLKWLSDCSGLTVWPGRMESVSQEESAGRQGTKDWKVGVDEGKMEDREESHEPWETEIAFRLGLLNFYRWLMGGGPECFEKIRSICEVLAYLENRRKYRWIEWVAYITYYLRVHIA